MGGPDRRTDPSGFGRMVAEMMEILISIDRRESSLGDYRTVHESDFEIDIKPVLKSIKSDYEKILKMAKKYNVDESELRRLGYHKMMEKLGTSISVNSRTMGLNLMRRDDLDMWRKRGNNCDEYLSLSKSLRIAISKSMGADSRVIGHFEAPSSYGKQDLFPGDGKPGGVKIERTPYRPATNADDGGQKDQASDKMAVRQVPPDAVPVFEKNYGQRNVDTAEIKDFVSDMFEIMSKGSYSMLEVRNKFREFDSVISRSQMSADLLEKYNSFRDESVFSNSVGDDYVIDPSEHFAKNLSALLKTIKSGV